jgi:hypothetical protein
MAVWCLVRVDTGMDIFLDYSSHSDMMSAKGVEAVMCLVSLDM